MADSGAASRCRGAAVSAPHNVSESCEDDPFLDELANLEGGREAQEAIRAYLERGRQAARSEVSWSADRNRPACRISAPPIRCYQLW
jgi:hypothetical protein